jgi:hypothetical protein
MLYAGLPNSSRWYEVAEPGEKAGARALIYLGRKDGVGAGDFRKLINKELVPALAGTGVLRELRTQTFLPWNKKLWDTPNVAHDNPADQRFHASLILGFTDAQERAGFFHGREIDSLSNTLAPLTSAIHAYDVSAALRQGRHDPPALSAVLRQEESVAEAGLGLEPVWMTMVNTWSASVFLIGVILFGTATAIAGVLPWGSTLAFAASIPLGFRPRHGGGADGGLGRSHLDRAGRAPGRGRPISGS